MRSAKGFLINDAQSCACYFGGGPDRQIHEADEFPGIVVSHFFKESDVVFLGVFIDGTDMIRAGPGKGNIDLPAVSGRTVTFDIFLPVQAAENIGDSSGCDSQL